MLNALIRRGKLLLLASVATVAALAAAPASGTVVGYWDFEGDVQDGSGNGRNGTILGNPTFVANAAPRTAYRSRTSLSFDGTGDAVEVPFIGAFNLSNTTGLTISAWVNVPNFSTAANRRIYGEGSSTDNDPLYDIFLNTVGRVGTIIRNDTQTLTSGHSTPTNTLANGQWFNVVWTDVVGSGGVHTTRLYANGAQIGAAVNYTPLGAYTMNRTLLGALGRSTPSEANLIGLIDEVAVWNEALSPSLISQLAFGANPLSIPEPSTAFAAGLALAMACLRRRSR